MSAAAPVPVPPYPHARPEPYHRIQRTWTYAWWRSLVGVVLGFVAWLVSTAVVVVPFIIIDAATSGVALEDYLQRVTERLTPLFLLATNLSLAALILVAALLVRLLHSLRPRWLSSVLPGLRWGLLARTTGLALAVVAVATAVSVLVMVLGDVSPTLAEGGGPTALGRTLGFVVVVALTTPLQAAGEEYFFRGYLLQAFGSWVRSPWFTVAVTSVLFTALHGVTPWQSLPLFLDRFAFGVAAGWLAVRTGGLEAPIALHAVNNLAAFGLAIAAGQIDSTLTASDAPWSLVVVDIVQVTAFALLADRLVRRSGVRTRTEGPPALAQAAVPPPVFPATR